MARIRTIKPEFFRHEGLQDLAAKHGAELMLIFAGLWGHCDKAGRFEWKPRTLKLDILPFLDFDMAKMLDVLWQSGFVRRYESNGKEYGEIDSFEKHQRISGKEAQEPEKHPEPLEYKQGSNREATGKQLGLQEGKGREEEGKGMDINVELRSRRASIQKVFDFWRTTLNHERSSLDAKRSKLIEARMKDGYTVEQLCNAITGCSLSPWHMGENDDGRRYDGLDLILRDGSKVDQFVGFCSNPPRPKQPQVPYRTVGQERADTIAALTGRNKPAPDDVGRLIEGDVRHVA